MAGTRTTFIRVRTKEQSPGIHEGPYLRNAKLSGLMLGNKSATESANGMELAK